VVTIKLILDNNLVADEEVHLHREQATDTCGLHGDVLDTDAEGVLLQLMPHDTDDDDLSADSDFALACLIEDATRCGVCIDRIEDVAGRRIW